MVRLPALIFLAWAYGTAAYASAPAYSLVAEKSFVKFFALQKTTPIQGQFKHFTADIHFDEEKLDESNIVFEVDVTSVEVSTAEIMKQITLPEWLSTDAFPKAVFKSKTISNIPRTNDYFSDGVLTLRGKSMPVTVNFQLEHSDEKVVVAKGFVTIRRGDFGVGQGQWAGDEEIANEVRVEFRLVANKQ